MALYAGGLYLYRTKHESQTRRLHATPTKIFRVPVSTSALREYVRTHAENRPGVYQMLGADGDPLYVGRSIRVRTRLLSYFRAPPGEKATKLIRETGRIRWEYIPNEFSTLVREMKLIQRSQPRFNVQHKRKRMYAFVKLTREIAPRILSVTRAVPDGSLYFGPFPAVGKVGATVRELAHVVGLRDCPGSTPMFFDDQLEVFYEGRAPLCIRAELGTCLAPCSGGLGSEAYRQKVATAQRFLEGRTREPLAVLESRMRGAVARLDFEYAAQIRDRIERLQTFQEHLTAFRGRIESLTFLYRVPGFAGDSRLYLIRRGRLRHEFPYPTTEGERQKIDEAVESVYRAPEQGPASLEPHDAAEILLVARWFELRPKELKRTATPRKWLAEGGIRPFRGRNRKSEGSTSVSAHALGGT
jgi:excinuclease ABC subunit C